MFSFSASFKVMSLREGRGHLNPLYLKFFWDKAFSMGNYPVSSNISEVKGILRIYFEICKCALCLRQSRGFWWEGHGGLANDRMWGRSRNCHEGMGSSYLCLGYWSEVAHQLIMLWLIRGQHICTEWVNSKLWTLNVINGYLWHVLLN